VSDEVANVGPAETTVGAAEVRRGLSAGDWPAAAAAAVEGGMTGDCTGDSVDELETKLNEGESTTAAAAAAAAASAVGVVAVPSEAIVDRERALADGCMSVRTANATGETAVPLPPPLPPSPPPEAPPAASVATAPALWQGEHGVASARAMEVPCGEAGADGVGVPETAVVPARRAQGGSCAQAMGERGREMGPPPKSAVVRGNTKGLRSGGRVGVAHAPDEGAPGDNLAAVATTTDAADVVCTVATGARVHVRVVACTTSCA